MVIGMDLQSTSSLKAMLCAFCIYLSDRESMYLYIGTGIIPTATETIRVIDRLWHNHTLLICLIPIVIADRVVFVFIIRDETI